MVYGLSFEVFVIKASYFRFPLSAFKLPLEIFEVSSCDSNGDISKIGEGSFLFLGAASLFRHG